MKVIKIILNVSTHSFLNICMLLIKALVLINMKEKD